MKESAYIQWDSSYSIGNRIIDRQHQVIIDCINELYAIFIADKDSASLQPICQRLKQYTKAHFVFEERMLSACQYPDLEQHKKIHEQMRLQTDAYLRCGEIDDHEAARKIFKFLKSWWLNHILGEDMAYAAYLHQAENLNQPLALQQK